MLHPAARPCSILDQSKQLLVDLFEAGVRKQEVPRLTFFYYGVSDLAGRRKQLDAVEMGEPSMYQKHGLKRRENHRPGCWRRTVPFEAVFALLESSLT